MESPSGYHPSPAIHTTSNTIMTTDEWIELYVTLLFEWRKDTGEYLGVNKVLTGLAVTGILNVAGYSVYKEQYKKSQMMNKRNAVEEGKTKHPKGWQEFTNWLYERPYLIKFSVANDLVDHLSLFLKESSTVELETDRSSLGAIAQTFSFGAISDPEIKLIGNNHKARKWIENWLRVHRPSIFDIKNADALVETANQNIRLILNMFYEVLEHPKRLTYRLLAEMFDKTSDIVLFKFPYTLARLALIEERDHINTYSKKDIQTLVYERLTIAAKEYIINDKCMAGYQGVLRSALKHKIINQSDFDELESIARTHRVLNHPRFKQLESEVEHLKEQVRLNTKNIHLLADELIGLKQALKNQAKRQLAFGMLKFALAFVGSQAIDMIQGISEFSNFMEIGSLIFNMPVEKVENSLNNGTVFIMNAAAEQVLKEAHIHPEEFLETWKQTTILLHAPVENQSGGWNKQEVGSISSLYATQSIYAKSRLQSPNSITLLPSTNDFFSWLNHTKAEGNFDISLVNKEVKIQFFSRQKNSKEINDVLITLNKFFKTLPDIQSLDIEERDIDKNCLTITTKTKLDAKELVGILESYGLLDNPENKLGQKKF